MWTETPEGRKLVTELSRQIVTQTAPEELDMFDELLADYYDNPTPVGMEPAADDPLAFGLAEAFVAATPIAAAMVSSMLAYILQEVVKTTQEEGAKAITKKISKVINPKEDEKTPLTREQMQQIRKQALKQAKAFGMDSKQAGKMADALIGRLTLAQ